MVKTSKSNPTKTLALLTGLSSKINQPLRSLYLSSQKLLDVYKAKNFEYISYKDFKQMIFTLEQMNRQIKHCYETTQRLINLDKSKSKLEFCSVHEVINEILDLFGPQFLACKIKTSFRFQKDIPKVKLSPIDGYQVMHNVISNAIQAMPGGGSIKIRTLFEKKSKLVIVEVIDQGVGIAPGHLPRVFEPFFTTKEGGIEKNTGLGLFIVHTIVQAVGGSIDIQSSLRSGTQVRIVLPAVAV